MTAGALTVRQRARVECLRAARDCLVARGPFPTGAPDVLDLVNLARYIETGEDPWPTPPFGITLPDTTKGLAIDR